MKNYRYTEITESGSKNYISVYAEGKIFNMEVTETITSENRHKWFKELLTTIPEEYATGAKGAFGEFLQGLKTAEEFVNNFNESDMEAEA